VHCSLKTPNYGKFHVDRARDRNIIGARAADIISPHPKALLSMAKSSLRAHRCGQVVVAGGILQRSDVRAGSAKILGSTNGTGRWCSGSAFVHVPSRQNPEGPDIFLRLAYNRGFPRG